MEYVIFGAGIWGMRFYARFGEEYNIVCFCDNDTAKQGKKYLGLPVVPVEEIVGSGLKVIIPGGKKHFEMARCLFGLGIKDFYLLHPENHSEVLHMDLSKFDDLSSNRIRICAIDARGTGANARALKKYNPYPDVDVTVIELEIAEPFDIYADGVSYYAYHTSDLFISSNLYDVFGKRCIELWHGFPVKALSYLANDGAVQKYSEYVTQVMNDARETICSYSKLYDIFLGRCMGVPREKFRITGMPRNDLLLRSDAKENLRKLLPGVPSFNRVVLYAPTFRETASYGYRDMKEGYFFSWPGFSYEDFDEFLKVNGILLLIKIHSAEIAAMAIQETENIVLLTDEKLLSQDLYLYEFLGAVDILITDYSSVAVDYLMLDKPIVYAVRDLEEYSEKHGIMTEPFDAWAPGECAYDYKGLKSAVTDILSGVEKYEGRREQMRRIMHRYNDANSSERVLALAREVLSNLHKG